MNNIGLWIITILGLFFSMKNKNCCCTNQSETIHDNNDNFSTKIDKLPTLDPETFERANDKSLL